MQLECWQLTRHLPTGRSLDLAQFRAWQATYEDLHTKVNIHNELSDFVAYKTHAAVPTNVHAAALESYQ